MRFDRHKDPTACADAVSTRYGKASLAILTRGETKFLAATNGKCLSLIEVTPDERDELGPDRAQLLPRDAIEAARRMARAARMTDATLNVNGDVKPPGGQSFPLVTDERFPHALEVVPKSPAAMCIRLDAAELARCIKALGAGYVELHVHDVDHSGRVPEPCGPLTVRAATCKGTADSSFCVIMPVSAD